MTIEEQLREKILTISENIKIRRFSRYEAIWSAMSTAAGASAYL
jgi:translation elongation factor EF-Ts